MPLRMMPTCFQDFAKGEDSSIMEKILVSGFVAYIKMASGLATCFGLIDIGCVTVVGKDNV